jgi:diguanylate cyclase (GGDEF)-like protein/PAS domain S-box-containing protein
MHVVMLSFLLSIFCVAASASNEVSGITSRAATHVTQLNKDTLIVGSEQDYPPFATGMTDATAGGFTVDLWKAVAAEAQLDYTIRVLPFHQLLQEFHDGKIDVLINLAYSEQRHRFADFTVPHVIVHGAIFVRKGNDTIRNEDDLRGKSIIVLKADLGHDYAVSKGWVDNLVLVDTAAEGFKLLATGKHEAMLLAKLTGVKTLNVLGLDTIQPLKIKIGFSQKFCVAVPEGQSKLLGQINEGFALTKANGTYDALFEKWFGAYEEKTISWSDVFVYLTPVIAIFLLMAGYFYYRRQIERELASAALAESQKLLSTIIDTAPIRIFWKDRDLKYLGCNAIFAKDAGAENPNEVIGKDDFQMVWATQAAQYREDDRTVIESAQPKLFYEEKQTTPTGDEIWLRTSKVPLKNGSGEIIGMLGMYKDITEEKHTQEQLLILLREQKAMLENELVGIVRVQNRIVIWANPAFERMLGYDLGELAGTSTRNNYVSEEAYNEMGRVAYPILQQGGIYRAQLEHLRKDGQIIWVDLSGAMLDFETGQSLWGFIEITQQKLAEEKIQNFAFYDTLTQLPNRRLLNDRLGQSMSASKRSGAYVALMYIDLDNFKPLNDLHGHTAGDLLLVEVAIRLKSCVREMDTVSRFGGDEFVVMLSELDTNRTKSKDEANRIAEKIRSALSEPYTINVSHEVGQDFTVEHICTASIGIVLFVDNEISQIDVLNRADEAMYQAKEAGRNQIRFYE